MSAPEVTALILERAAASAKAGLERTLGSTKVPQSRRHLVAAHPINVIPEVARRTRSAIVVMGAVSRSGLKRIVIGTHCVVGPGAMVLESVPDLHVATGTPARTVRTRLVGEPYL